MNDWLIRTRRCCLTAACVIVMGASAAIQQCPGQDPADPRPTYEQYLRRHLPDRRELDVFLNEMSWAQFDPELGYILGDFTPRDGVDRSATISTSQSSGARTSFLYRDRPCRINTYGNSFTQCHQVSDGETWQEYLAAHLGEPVRNFGMGGFGFYQAYRRMVREEQTEHSAEYVTLYIWGDDHMRSLLRCRYMLITAWNQKQDTREGPGRMFHGNFWSNIEMNLTSGEFEEHDSRLPTRESLYKMLDGDWMVENLRDDLALQMALYLQNRIRSPDVARLQRLARILGQELPTEDGRVSRESVRLLLDAYSFAATKEILLKARRFCADHQKKLMILLLDPGRVTRPLLEGRPRYDQTIVDFLDEHQFRVFDMNIVHQRDFEDFRLSPGDYMKRYYIGHYSPAGNHLFAFALKDSLVEWLDPKPLPYRDTSERLIDFQGYLPEY